MEFDCDIEKFPFLNADLPGRFRRRPIDYHELRRRISILQVLDLIGWKSVRIHGAQLRGPCPLHRSTKPNSRTFSVNVERDIFRCFKCSKAGNQLDFFAALTGLPLYEASSDLCERLGITIPYLVVPEADTKDHRASDD